MDWDAIGALAELLGAIAVIGTLVYLSVQIKQSASAHHTSTSWGFTQSLDALNARLSTSKGLTDIWIRGRRDAASLDEVEPEQFRAFCMALINLSIYAHTHPRAEYEYFNQNLANVTKENPGFREMLDSVEWSLPEELYRRLTTHA